MLTPYRSSSYAGDGSTGKALRDAMAGAGLSRAELSRLAGVDPTTVARMCSGDRVGTLDTWMRVRDVIGCTLDELVGLGGDGAE